MNYKVTITTRTPLHIGTGQELLAGYDVVADSQHDQTYRLNVDAILEHALGDEARLNEQILRAKPAELVEPAELRQAGSPFVVYRLAGRPQSGVVKEQIKDAWGRLYLPGSSFKGALRTAIGRYLAGDDQLKLKPHLQIDPQAKAKFADDVMDEAIFGRINRDILRALQVADSQPVDQSPQLINVSVAKGSEQQAPIDLEAIPAQTTFETVIHVEEYLFRESRKVVRQERKGTSQWVAPAQKLGWVRDKVAWLGDLTLALPYAGCMLADRRCRQEMAYCRKVGLTDLVALYQAWLKELPGMPSQHRFLLQIGWAGGWDSKTLGRRLIALDSNGKFDEATFAKIRTRFGLGRPPQYKGQWQAEPGQTFPASRRLVVASGQPMRPLGWVEAKVERIE